MFILLISVSCRDRSEVVVPIPYDLCTDGDLVFRRGLSFSSQVVLQSDRKSGYSHVGILVKDSLGEWQVIHAVPGEADEVDGKELMKKEPLSLFWQSDRASAGAIVRFPLSDSLRGHIAEKSQELFQRKLLFDHRYNHHDSSQMYCTELICFVYQSVNVNLTENRSHSIPGYRKSVIFPSDILQNCQLETIFQFGN